MPKEDPPPPEVQVQPSSQDDNGVAAASDDVTHERSGNGGSNFSSETNCHSCEVCVERIFTVPYFHIIVLNELMTLVLILC